MTTDEALLTLQLDGMERLAEAHDVLAAEVRRCHARRCETCKHQQCYGDYEECDRTQGDDYGNRTECKTMGGGCLAWEKRDE